MVTELDAEPQPPHAVTHVEDGEVVRRAVRDDPTHFGCDEHGVLTYLGQSAFNDRDKTPSVDRASLLHAGPQAARRLESDGVVSLLTRDVRAIAGLVTNDHRGRPQHSHGVDVVHRPESDNYAHALVTTAPQITSGEVFKRLKESLCQLALRQGWSYPPASRRDQ